VTPDERTFTLDRRFNGPANSANGGFVCGTVAELAAPSFGPEVTVTLHSPPPLATPLVLRAGRQRGHVYAGEELIASVAPGASRPPAPAPVPVEAALRAERAFAGESGHPFPTCFVCGPDRAAGDGLRLRPGRLPDRPDAVACTWVPDAGSVPLLWSVLDCPGGWAADPVTAPAVLGRMSARLLAPAPVGERCVVVAELLERSQRTTRNVSAVYAPDGELVGVADAIWVRVDPAVLQAVRG